MATRLMLAKTRIEGLLDTAPHRAFKASELQQIYRAHRNEWRLPKSLNFAQFMDFLVEEDILREVCLDATPYRKEVRYVRGKATIFELALSVRPRSYLCHASAVFLHGLMDKAPALVTVNQEQSPKPQAKGIAGQEAIDRAFSKPHRSTNYRFRYEEGEIGLLNGKATNRHGVEPLVHADGVHLEVTGLERTLVDIVVRPQYAGGSKVVDEAYRRAKDRVKIKNVVSTLAALDYVYPYHQAIGFWLQRSGFPPKQLKALKELGMAYRFHVDHALEHPAYDDNWKVYYPADL